MVHPDFIQLKVHINTFYVGTTKKKTNVNVNVFYVCLKYSALISIEVRIA